MKLRPTAVLAPLPLLLVLTGCSGKSSPASATPTLASITITSSGTTLVLGLTETFTATASFSNGTTQPLTGGTWGTDAPGVATVNPATGLVTSVARGDVTIFVDAQGVRGSKRITVVPGYTGTWSGAYTITSCTQTGDWTSPAINLCSILSLGSTLPAAFTLTQTGTSVSGQTALGSLVSSPFTTTAAANGALTFQAVTVQDTTRVAQAWQLSMTASAQLAGTVVQTWTDTTLAGQAVVSGTLQNVTKVSSITALETRPDRTIGSIARMLAAVAGR